MKSRRFFLIMALAMVVGIGTVSAQIDNITPAPVRFHGGTCNDECCTPAMPFDYSQLTELYIEGGDVVDAERLEAAVKAAGLNVKRTKRPQKSGDIRIYLNPESMSFDEGYAIVTAEESVYITAKTSAGAFYALQTIRQLVESGEWLTGAIVDYPRFDYRGILIDISRHHRSVEFLKRQIDMMARLKMNRLHLHLTDAAGWRIEVEAYPRLTEYAAWRKGATWKEWWSRDNRDYAEMGTEGAYGGYLTKEDAKELVRYAADRYITIIPEIEMPGHSAEVVAAYPELACSQKPEQQEDLCIGKEATFEMMQTILDEIIEIFPSEYIHIGGDEATKKSWTECEDCQPYARGGSRECR